MKKRLLSFVLVLAMVLSLLPTGVVAEGTEEHVHCLCGANKTKGTTCTDCGSEAVVWTATETMPASGTGDRYYYLTKAVKTTEVDYTGGHTAICLHGQELSATGGRIAEVMSGNATLTITDCDGDETKGTITGTNHSSYGAAFRVYAGCTLNLYNGWITGNTTTNDGIICVNQGTATVVGGTFNMYGGKISGNTMRRGAVYTELSASTKDPVVRILGGEIAGNTGTGKGSTTGGAGVLAFSPVEIGGNAKIYGNTAAVGPADLYLRNDQEAKLILSADKPLSAGANVQYDLNKPEGDTTDLKQIIGTPETWKNIWLSYAGQKVGYADGKFFVDNGPADTEDQTQTHIHCLCGAEKTKDNTCAKCGSKAVEWTGTSTMPADVDGYYYLTQAIEKDTTKFYNNDVAICLHGKDIVSASTTGCLSAQNGATVIITDCDDDDTKGLITGSKNSSALPVMQDSTLKLYGGTISGNTNGSSSGAGIIWLQKGTATKAGGAFYMYGGQITGNTTKRGAIFTEIPDANTLPAVIQILGGEITGNTGTNTAASTGGGAGIYALVPVVVGGDAKIYGNTGSVTTGTIPNADLYLRNDSTFTGKLVVSTDMPLAAGANISYGTKTAESDATNLQYITGAPTNWDSSWVSCDGEQVGYANGKFFLASAAPQTHVHCLCGEEITQGNTCAKCGTEAVEWTKITAMPSIDQPGYYYLENDVTVAPFFVSSGKFAFCLCGHTMTSAEGKRIMDVSGGATISITDCAENVGTITGAASLSDSGSTIRVNAGSTFNIYNGKITGNTASDDGIIYVNKGTADTIGGTFNMYGGELSGNTVRRGTVYAALATGEEKTPVVRILGGLITNNTGTGEGTYSKGAGVYGLTNVEIGGDAKIYGNVDTAGFPNLYIRDDQGFKLIVSSQAPLTDGAKICYSTATAEPDLSDLQYITGAPANWDSSWVSYNDRKVGYTDGKFFVDLPLSDHIHCLCGAEKTLDAVCADCGSKAVRWNGTDAMPTAAMSGYYYLTDNVIATPLFYKNSEKVLAICLCGHSVTSAEGKRIIDVSDGATLSITDCAEEAGSITGSTGATHYGSVMRVNAGSTLNLYNGKVTGNTGESEGVIYVDFGTEDVAGGTFNMYGGEVSNNSVKRGAVYTALANEGVQVPVVRILGGVITGNTGTGTGSTGGGAGVFTFYPVEIGGNAQIYGNTSATGPADLYLRDDIAAKLVISTDVPLTEGAKVCYGTKNAEADITDLLFITGEPTSWNSGWVSYNNQQVGRADGKFFLDASSSSHVHCLCGAETTLGKSCAKCGTEAVGWLATDSMPTSAGNYYLTNDITATPLFYKNSIKDLAICLCGHTVTSAEGKRIIDVSDGATLSITDCAQEAGSITGSTGATHYGSVMRVNAGSTLNLYNGKVTGNTGESEGIIYIDAGTEDTIGGTFNMYGGEVSDNTVSRGAIYTALNDEGAQAPVVRILGGVITGNTGTGTGSTGGGAGVFTFYPVEIGGNAKIYGNTAAAGNADLYLRNDFDGQIVLSEEVPLGEGAKISYGASAGDDKRDLQTITGEPALWDNNWVLYNGSKVGYADDKFFVIKEIIQSDHKHDDQMWQPVTEGGLMPLEEGYYFLEEDVQLTSTLVLLKGEHVNLCLNGHTLTAAEGLSHFDIRNGASLTICDCTAETAKDGKYTAGNIAGGNGANGGAIRARAGSEVNLYDGIFTDNTTPGNGGVIYMDAASADHPGAIFRMYGGMLCGNSGAYGAAVRLGAPAEGLAGPTFIMEGGAICHNTSPNYGGALHAAGGATVELIGGIIEENKAELGGGGLSINGTTAVNLSGTVIRNNTATTWGGGVYIKTGAVMTMTGGEISGNSAKVGAGILMESKDTTLNMQDGLITGNKAGAAGGAGIYGSTGTVVNMSGGKITANESEAGGGGIVLYRGIGNFTGGEISKNKANGGAGMTLQGSEVKLGKVKICDNVSSGSSGGVYVARASSYCSNVIIDGAIITGNSCESSGGGMFVYMNGNVVTMESGKISGNTAENGGGVLVQRECTFTLNGGEISGNTSKTNGGGYYASIDSTFIMNGGKITENYSGTNGAGLYCLRSTAKLNGGTIGSNTAKTTAGGIMASGAKIYLNGTWVSYNKALEGSGGGVMIQSTTMKVDGVSTRFSGYMAMTGGAISYNTTPKAAGGLLVQAKDTVVDIYGGKISNNVSTKFAAGVYVGKNAMFNMHGGEVSYNVTENDVGGGIRHDGGSGTYTGGEIFGNSTTRSGGGILVSGETAVVNLKNVKIYDNTAKVAAGVLLQGKATLNMEDCEVYNNTATTNGAGVYCYTYVTLNMKNCNIHDNVAQVDGGGVWSWATSYMNFDGCQITNNKAVEGQGGALWTRGDGVTILNSTISGNAAAGNGGGICTGMMGSATPRQTPGLIIENTLIEKNTSGGIGGGLYQASGSDGTLRGVSFIGNTAAAEGGALWAKDEFTMHSVKATGNVSGGEGYAVYLADSDFDGHSFFAGLMKISGDMIVRDNTGGNLYLGEKTTMVVGEEGLGKDTHMELTLHSGLLTDMVWGAYNYEGGDLNYTITYGDRSMTDPEVRTEADAPSQEPTGEATEPADGEQKEPKDSGVLIIGIGAMVAVLAAAAITIVLVANKKKKSSK